MSHVHKIKFAAVTALAAAAMAIPQAGAQEVNVYSYRQPFLVEPLFDAFTAETGIPVNVVFADKGVVERIQREGPNSPADLILTVDISRLDEAYEAGVTQPVATDVLKSNVPPQYQGPGGHWYGLTARARIVYASKDRVDPADVTTYEDLADPRWAGRICTRSGSHVYQIGLLAAMIAHHGEDRAKQWLTGLRDNLARKPQGNDRAQVKAILEGECDISLGNNYYYGKMLDDPEQVAWAESSNVLFPEFEGGGTHLNISGVALTKSSPNKDAAIQLMEFLASPLGQEIYAEQNYEYPVLDGVPRAELLENLGAFEPDTVDLSEVAELRAAALRIVNEVGYDN